MPSALHPPMASHGRPQASGEDPPQALLTPPAPSSAKNHLPLPSMPWAGPWELATLPARQALWGLQPTDGH